MRSRQDLRDRGAMLEISAKRSRTSSIMSAAASTRRALVSSAASVVSKFLLIATRYDATASSFPGLEPVRDHA